MNIDTYQQIAIGVCARLADKKPFSVVLTSSSEKVSCAPIGKELAKAFASLKLSTAVVDAAGDGSKLGEGKAVSSGVTEHPLLPGDAPLTLEQAKALCSALNGSYDAAIIVTGPLKTADTAMLFTAAAGNVIFAEKKKVSRTDQIDAAMDAAKTLGAFPVGFILE